MWKQKGAKNCAQHVPTTCNKQAMKMDSNRVEGLSMCIIQIVCQWRYVDLLMGQSNINSQSATHVVCVIYADSPPAQYTPPLHLYHHAVPPNCRTAAHLTTSTVTGTANLCAATESI